MILSIADFCDSKFEYKPGMDCSFDLDAVRQAFSKGRVIGGISHYITFLYWQLKRHGYSPRVWKTVDYYYIECEGQFITYNDDRAPFKLLSYSDNLKDWYSNYPEKYA